MVLCAREKTSHIHARAYLRTCVLPRAHTVKCMKILQKLNLVGATVFWPADCSPTPDFHPRPGWAANARIQDLPGILLVSAFKSIQAFWVHMPLYQG